MFGYEQALGYLVASRPLDKDGITAAVLMAEIAAVGRRGGHDAAGPPRRHRGPLRPPRDRRPLGAMDPAAGGERVRDCSPTRQALGGAKVVDVTAYPEADLLRLDLEGGSASRSARAAPSPRSSCTARPSTPTPRPTSTPSLADLLTG